MEELVRELVNEFKLSIPNNQEAMVKKFEEYLYSLIEQWQNPKSKFLVRSEEEIEEDLRETTKRFATYDLEEKERILIEDENFSQLISISNNIYETALGILNNNGKPIDEEDIERKIANVIKVSGEVKSYNAADAKKLVSESILDFNFIKNPQKGVLSIRLAEQKRMKEETNKKDEEEER